MAAKTTRRPVRVKHPMAKPLLPPEEVHPDDKLDVLEDIIVLAALDWREGFLAAYHPVTPQPSEQRLAQAIANYLAVKEATCAGN
jgi:hypothetical protein